MGKEKEKKKEYGGLFIVIVTLFSNPWPNRDSTRGRRHVYLAILYSLPKSVAQIASHKKYYCASSNLKNIIKKKKKKKNIKVRRCKAYFLCMLFLYASRKRTRLIKDKEHFQGQMIYVCIIVSLFFFFSFSFTRKFLFDKTALSSKI